MMRPDLPPSMPRPQRLLSQNSELRRIGVWNWTLPALAARLPDGRTIRTCPAAGVCATVCYARNGTYNIPAVKARHLANLAYVLDDPTGWERAMITELHAPRFQHAWVRIHDSGDFFSDPYLAAWLRIITACPLVSFYAYTKEIRRFRRLVEPEPPPNFRWVYSLGGSQDGDLDLEADRVADVFPTVQAIQAAGWHSQDASDLLAVTGPAPVGIPANNIPRFRRRQGDRTFGQWQAQTRCHHHRGRPANTHTANTHTAHARMADPECRSCPPARAQSGAAPAGVRRGDHGTGHGERPRRHDRSTGRTTPNTHAEGEVRRTGTEPPARSPDTPDRRSTDGLEVEP